MLSAAVFAPSLRGPFLFDDQLLIPSNPFVHDGSWWWRWFTHDFWDVSPHPEEYAHRIRYWRPLVLASFAVDWQLWYGHPLGFHLTNLALHGLASALVFGALRRYVGSSAPAALGTLLFAIHPSKADSVAWIAGRSDILATVGILIAAAGIARRLRGERGGIPLEALGTSVAYLAKETALILPWIAVVERWIELGRPPLVPFARRRLLLTAAPQLLLALTYLMGRWLWVRSLGSPPLSRRLTTSVWSVFDALGHTAETLFWPARLSLGRAQIEWSEAGMLPMLHATLGALLLAGSLGLTAAVHRRRPRLTIALVTGLLLLAPALAMGAGGAAESTAARILYLPLVGFGWLGAEVLVGPLRRQTRCAAPFAVAALLALGVRSATRTLDFTSTDRFWRHELRSNPRYGPALAHFIERELARGRPRAALALAHQAFARSARVGSPVVRGVALSRSVEALLRITPDQNTEALRRIRGFLRAARHGQPATLELPSHGLQVSLEVDSPEARWLRSSVARQLPLEAEAASRLGDDEAARAACREAIERCPTCAGQLRRLILAATRSGDLPLAEGVLTTLEPRLEPSELRATRGFLAEVHRRLASIEAADGEQRHLHRARYFALTTAWGRALDAARPLLATDAALPSELRRVLGEYAFRAGDHATADRLLAPLLPPAELALLQERWRREMLWVDAGEPDPLLEQLYGREPTAIPR